MRYLYLLFFCFLSLHSYLVFANEPPAPICSTTISHAYNNVCSSSNFFQSWINSCINGTGNNAIQQTSQSASCVKDGSTQTYYRFACKANCTCPDGYSFSEGTDINGNSVSGCSPDTPTETPPDDCPSGQPKVNGQCAVCPNGFNPDGTCSDGCPPDKTKQGEINGNAICMGSCTDPNQSYGIVNGVEGCHGPGTDPTCPNGGAYGYVNGVPGCYGGGSGDGSGDGSGGGGSSSGGGGGDGSGGAGGSSGSGSGSGGDGGGGSPGGGGSGSGSNNDMGSSYDEAEACPVGMIKSGNKCVSDGRGDCIVGYHELVISRDPYLFICVADDPPPSSSSPSASSQPSSQASSSPSSQSASAASASAASGGATGSSGSGSGGGGGGAGDGDSGAGDCDPTAADYFKCSGMLEELSGDDLESMNQSIDDTNTKSLQDYEKLLKDDLDDFERDGVSFADEPSLLKNLLQSFLPVSSACNPPTFNIRGRSHTLDCTYFDAFKAAFGWFLAVLTAFQIWQLAIRPVER